MSFLKNIVWSPKEYADSAVVAYEAGVELLARLDWLTIKPKVILDVGSGIGAHSQLLQARFPDAVVISLDLSLAMLQQAQAKMGVCADAVALPLANQSVDIIFANFFLPWQDEVKGVMREWRRVLVPNGVVMLTVLGLNTLQEYRAILDEEHTPHCVDMHDVGDALIQAGFTDPVLDVGDYVVTYRLRSRLLHELVASAMWAPEQVLAEQWLPNAEGVWPVTYEIVYAHAFTPLPSNEFLPAADGEVKIPLSHLRRPKKG